MITPCIDDLDLTTGHSHRRHIGCGLNPVRDRDVTHCTQIVATHPGDLEAGRTHTTDLGAHRDQKFA